MWILANMQLDQEEMEAKTCPSCRKEAEKPKCVRCGGDLPLSNPKFDKERFEKLKRGEE